MRVHARMAAFAAIPLLFACAADPADEEGPAKPRSVTFTGKVDPALAGHWETDDRSSILDLGGDGKLGIVATTSSPGGKMSTKNQGAWLIDGDRLLMKYGAEKGDETVVAYRFKATGERLTLSTRIPKTETVYSRHK